MTRITWFGQSAFLVAGSHRVFVDPFGDMSERLRESGRRFDYPAIQGVDADVLLVTHEHFDHNAVEVVGGDPFVVRSQAGTVETPVGEVVGIASEHDPVAGTARGHNTIYRFALDGTRYCHFGDFGQAALRPEQREAIGEVDVLFLPAGAGPTVAHDVAAGIVRELDPRTTVLMHYGNDAVDFLESPDGLLAALRVEAVRLDASVVDELPEGVVLFGVPRP
jgi:L-ascorbate metabolism protein UlaG (beta-lactamase superfamily)